MKTNNLDSISSSLEKTLLSPDLVSIGVDLSETAIDSFLSEGVIKDIPVISVLFNSIRSFKNIHDYLFLKKILYFISKVATISQKEREESINEINTSEKHRINVGEKLLYIIDKSEDHKTAEIVGRLFASFLKRELSYSDFLKASNIVNNIFIDDLMWFVEYKGSYDISKRTDDLMYSGLFSIYVSELQVDVTQKGSPTFNGDARYDTDVNGGELVVEVSSIGTIIKNILKSE